jgi:hypothetical protein
LSVDGRGITNVALGKPTRVSSTHADCVGDRATNGHREGVENRWVSDPDDPCVLTFVCTVSASTGPSCLL